MKKTRVILLEPGKTAQVVEIENTLEAKQELVGGLIEIVHTFDDNICIIANEEAKCFGADLNRGIKDERRNLANIILGPAFICGLTETGFTGLTTKQIPKYLQMFELPERFFSVMGKRVAIPYRPE